MTARTRLVCAGGFGCLVVVGAGYAARTLLQLGDLYPWRAGVLFAVLMLSALRFVHAHPFRQLGPANWVTLLRAMLIALVTALIGEPRVAQLAAVGVAVAAIAAALDGLDGPLARRSRLASAFGARFDMETDALLVLGLSLLVWQYEKAGVWVLASGLMRYVFVAAGWVLPWMTGPLTPTMRGKTVAVLQPIGLCVALAPIVPVALSAPVAAAALAALTWSFAVDVGRLWRQAH